MKKIEVKVGIIGSGFAARFHYEALIRVYGVSIEIVGVFSPDKEESAIYAEERGITAWDDIVSLIDSCDVIHLCTPPSTHEPLAVQVLDRGKSVVVEKPFTGYYGDDQESFNGDSIDPEIALTKACESIQRMLDAENRNPGQIFYAENWIYAPAIQKEKEILQKTGGQILWIRGEESHSGSHSPYYGIWSYSGGGSLVGKAVHPLTAALYLKSVEGLTRFGKPIRPKTISARTHNLTRMDNLLDEGFIKTGYKDIEDFGVMHITFEDGTIADIFASEIVIGGINNHMEVNATNHRAILNINPNDSMKTYNPVEENFKDIYVLEKIGTKQGWAQTSPDEDWYTGYYHEMESFYSCFVTGQKPESNSQLAADTITCIYTAYASARNKGVEETIPLLY